LVGAWQTVCDDVAGLLLTFVQQESTSMPTDGSGSSGSVLTVAVAVVLVMRQQSK
jgi:hypothetical protein